jgi:hypothetical protein
MFALNCNTDCSGFHYIQSRVEYKFSGAFGEQSKPFMRNNTANHTSPASDTSIRITFYKTINYGHLPSSRFNAHFGFELLGCPVIVFPMQKSPTNIDKNVYNLLDSFAQFGQAIEFPL